MEVADPQWNAAGPRSDTTFMIPGLLRLQHEGMLYTLICTITLYLDSQQKWREFVQHGLQCLLRCLCANMQLAAKAFLDEATSQVQVSFMIGMDWYYDVLSQASEFYSTRPVSFPAKSDELTGKAMPRVSKCTRLMYSAGAKGLPHAVMSAFALEFL